MGLFVKVGSELSRNSNLASIFKNLTILRNFTLHSLPQHYESIQETCRKFAENELKPIAGRLDQDGNFPKAEIAKLADLGLMGILASEEYGGSGHDILATTIAVEELSRGCASTGVIVSIHNALFVDLLETRANPRQKEEFLEPYTNGIPGAFALSESNAGSDVANLSTTAQLDGETYIINGSKTWVTSAAEAEVAIVFATVDRTKKHKGISAFIVPLNTPGVSRGDKEDKLGIRAVSTCSLFFDNVRIPKSNLLGQEGQGFRIAVEQLNKARLGIASQGVGIAQAALDTALEYSMKRQAFGAPLSNLQAVQLRLARMATRIEAARLLIRKAASMCDAGENFIQNSSMAKLFAGETANFAASECVQILGGMGLVKNFPAERYFRDARVTEIYGGVSDVQMIVIADQLFKNSIKKKI